MACVTHSTLTLPAASEAVRKPSPADLAAIKLPPGFSLRIYHQGTLPGARSLALSGNSKKSGPVIVYVSSGSSVGNVRGWLIVLICMLWHMAVVYSVLPLQLSDVHSFAKCCYCGCCWYSLIPMRCMLLFVVNLLFACFLSCYVMAGVLFDSSINTSQSLYPHAQVPQHWQGAPRSCYCCPLQVYALVDSNGDGTADRTLTVLKGLDTPVGITWLNGSLYVAQFTSGSKGANGKFTGGHAVIKRYDKIDDCVLQNKVGVMGCGVGIGLRDAERCLPSTVCVGLYGQQGQQHEALLVSESAAASSECSMHSCC